MYFYVYRLSTPAENPTCGSANVTCPSGFTALSPSTSCPSLTCNLTDCCAGVRFSAAKEERTPLPAIQY